MFRSHSLRHQLAFTYAGIALLAALLLGGILLGVLGEYYTRTEDAYLQAAAEQIMHGLPMVSGSDQLERWAQLAALSTQTRVRVLNAAGSQLADSGSPRDIDAGSLTDSGEAGRASGERERLPRPLGSGLFGGGASARSSRSLQVALRDSSGQIAGYLELSDAPASGRDVLRGVAEAWVVAAALAVALAAAIGYMLSRRISQPIVALTDASDRMAEGDLTARAEVDREDEVGKLAESFNLMAERIETTVTALRRFVADAAHEIGTPLTALQADLELAETESMDEDERRHLIRALGQARRLEALSSNLLRLSRIEAGGETSEPVRVDLSAVAREAADTVASRAEQAGLHLELSIAEESLVVLAERAKLDVVVGNLLDNAVKFTPAGGLLTLGTRREGDSAILWVSDTGVGIPESEHPSVFGRFHRGRNVAAYAGSGLGLAIVRATVDSLGGQVSFESSEAGTRFDVRLPLVGKTEQTGG